MKSLKEIQFQDILAYVKGLDKKTWTKIGVYAGIFLVIVFIFIWPAWVTRGQVKAKIKMIEGQIMTTNTLLMKQPQLLKNKSEYTIFITKAKERLYPAGEASPLLGAISKMAEENKVGIIASKPKAYEGKFPAPFDTQFEGNAYDFTVEGGYHNVATFISRIESNPKLLRVQRFHFRPNEENQELHLADISFSAVSFKKDKV